MSIASRHVSALRGAALSCKGSPQEAAPRMLNNLDREVAERPDERVVEERAVAAQRSGSAVDTIVDTLCLEHDVTLVMRQMAASWNYIGTQGILQRAHIDERASGLEDALARVEQYGRDRVPCSIAIGGNAADLLPELVWYGVVPDVLTEQTSASVDVPNGLSFANAGSMRRKNPAGYLERSMEAMAQHVRTTDLERPGSVVLEYGSRLRPHVRKAGVADAFEVPGVLPESIRPLLGLVRHAVSGYPEAIGAAQRQGIDMPSLSSQGGLGR